MQRPSILVIEDEEELAQYIASVVERIDFETFRAGSVGDALRLIARQGYVLILADFLGTRRQYIYRWPLLQLLARFAPRTPTLALSALREVPSDGRVAGVVPLPFSEDDLVQQVKRHASKRPNRPENPFLARHLAALWDANAGEATQVILEAQGAGWSAAAIYDNLLATALYEIGAWWEADSCTVAEEHGARGITDRIMAMVDARAERKPARGRRILIACVPGERHELGARMAADAFAWDGWSVRFLGEDTPGAEVVDEAGRYKADMVGLSATLRPSWEEMRSEIAQLHTAGIHHVILGGQGFQSLEKDDVVSLGAAVKAEKVTTGVEIADNLLTTEGRS